MAMTLRLTVITGPHRGTRFCFRGPTCCSVGRAPDCFVKLAGDGRDSAVSRHHCQLAVDLPSIWVHDLGSTNGTFVNGAAIPSPSQETQHAARCSDPECPAVSLQDGDVLTIGGTSLRVDVVDCPPPPASDQGPAVWKPGEVAKKDCPISC